MIQLDHTPGRTARRTTILVASLLVAGSGTAAAHGSGGYGGGAMGGGWGLFGGAMGGWGLLWMGLLLAIPVYLVFALVTRADDRTDERPLSVLHERYARGELTDDEFERRRERLDRSA